MCLRVIFHGAPYLCLPGIFWLCLAAAATAAERAATSVLHLTNGGFIHPIPTSAVTGQGGIHGAVPARRRCSAARAVWFCFS